MTNSRDGIRAVVGVVFPFDDAAYIGQVIDYVERKGGAPLSPRLASIRQRIAAAMVDLTHADASSEVPVGQSLIALGADDCIGTAEAAEQLGIPADAVRWHYRSGNLKGRKIGRQVLITAASIEVLKARRAEKRKGEVA